MTVYIVIKHNGSPLEGNEPQILKVFKTEHQAEAFVRLNGMNCEYEE